ncbi:hypothetical protein ACRTDY_04680 [Vibrio alginolyticus]|uniref:hypothetical protein n=1 Tax=Vibrio alginolyticus TaxID=663 RepID=UPI001BD52987|nr:hypothetical protein [Vibrio alginolyticus]MBS9974358.1 hypothetical protein [Vibrio alginolyticus]MBT0020391.1 hypothetical protein [Vibrio alginolyticus]MCS0039771.1 hypothetical protein [Vibrio alginolyticus]
MSILTYRNSQEAFIGKHITSLLEQDGHEELDVKRAVERGIVHYRNTAGFAKGKVFDECLARAKQMLSPKKPKRTRKSKIK